MSVDLAFQVPLVSQSTRNWSPVVKPEGRSVQVMGTMRCGVVDAAVTVTVTVSVAVFDPSLTVRVNTRSWLLDSPTGAEKDALAVSALARVTVGVPEVWRHE